MAKNPPAPSSRAATTVSSAALRTTLGLLPVLAISTGIAAPGFAQTTTTTTIKKPDSVELDEITLQGASGDTSKSYTVEGTSSQKSPAPLIDTPKSVTVITKKEIQERGATTLADIMATTPGITIRAGEGGTQAGDNIYIRGFDASSETLIDGVRNSARTSYEAFNLESVEVTRGSDGAAVGAGSEGGSVSMNTKKPLPGKFDEVSLSFGTGAYKRATLDSNREFGAFGARLNLMYQDADDYQGKKGKTSKRYGVAPSLSYAISDRTKVTAGIYYYKNKDMPDYGVRMSGTATNPDYAVGSGTAADPWQPIDVPTGTFYGTPGRDFTDNSNSSIYARVDHDFSDQLKFSATVRKNHDVTKYVVTQPATTATGITRGQKSTNRKTDTLSLNAQLSGDMELMGLRHRFGLGVDVSRAETTAYRWLVDGVLGGTIPSGGEVSYVGPDLGYTPVSFGTGTRSSFAKVNTRSVYAFDVVDLAPKWEATFGVNWTSFDAGNHSYDTDGSTVTAEASKKSILTNGSAGIVFKPTENGRIYASISTASNPVGLSSTASSSSTSSSSTSLDPETSTSYELGTKWALFDSQLLLSANLFRTEKDNMRVLGDDGVNYDNVGKSRAKGIEIGFAGQITEKWGVSGGYVYQDVISVDGGSSTNAIAQQGKQIAKIPKNSFSLWTTYAYNDQLTIGGGATYVDKRVAAYTTDSVTGDAYASAIVPDSWRVDLMASYAFNEDTSLQLNVNNVFDEHIYGDSHSTQHVYVEPGRNYTVTLRHRF